MDGLGRWKQMAHMSEAVLLDRIQKHIEDTGDWVHVSIAGGMRGLAQQLSDRCPGMSTVDICELAVNYGYVLCGMVDRGEIEPQESGVID